MICYQSSVSPLLCSYHFAGKPERELMALIYILSLPLCPPPTTTALPSGYSPTIKGQLLHVDTTSSMQYRTLLEAEMLAVSSGQSQKRQNIGVEVI